MMAPTRPVSLIVASMSALRPYDDKTWGQGGIHIKAELTEDLQKKVSAYPGVIFNFTQPAEDAVDEALTGLCRAPSRVKIYGDDLQVLEDAKPSRSSGVPQQVPRLHGADRGARTGPAHGSD